MPSAIVCWCRSRTGVPAASEGGQTAAPSACTPIRLHALDSGGDPADQPASAGGHQYGCDVGQLLEQFQAYRALAGDHVGMVERVDEHRPGVVREGPRGCQRFFDDVADEVHLRTVSPGRGHLRQCGGHRHVDRCGGAQHRCCQRHTLPVVARTGSDHAPGPLGGGQRVDPDVGTPDLE
jgi:hypothetical protein